MADPTRILLIDDDSVDRASVRRALKSSGIEHTLAEAPDGETGLSLAKSQSFDCILLDYRLPDVDAFDLLAMLIAPENGSQGVLMLTGEADQDLAFRLMRAGALDYIAKGEATPSGLARAIRYATARRAFLTELERARRDAEEKSHALDMLNQQKTLLFSIIAHDLRNPFQALLGMSTILSETLPTQDFAAIERRAQAIREAASQAYTLMESLFQWARLQMDTIAFEVADVDVADVVREAVDGMANAIAAKDISVTSDCAGAHVAAHRDMLATIVRNLVNNAFKFTMQGGAITVSAKPSGDAIEIVVADTGVGMTPQTLDNLFSLDRRSTSVGTAGERGSGFGLLLCRDLVERLGGELKADSVLGVGTRFHFVLPTAR